jgi:hypothetical protein
MKRKCPNYSILNPQVMDIPKSTVADYQTTVKISCTVNTCPTAKWTWQKNGQVINFDGSRTINRNSLIEVRLQSFGVHFYC